MKRKSNSTRPCSLRTRTKRLKTSESNGKSNNSDELNVSSTATIPHEAKWTFLEHNGPLFPPKYRRLPPSIRFRYAGRSIIFTNPEAEEAATFYAQLGDHAMLKKEVFRRNFFNDWRKLMTPAERKLIVDFSLCNFHNIRNYLNHLKEQKKNISRAAKDKKVAELEALREQYGMCTVDERTEKVGNFRIEPPGIFRGRGNHPSLGKIKRRIQPEDIIINCSQDSHIPRPPKGHRWKGVIHNDSVTWLACWDDIITHGKKYLMLNASSQIQMGKDRQKFQIARKLCTKIGKIREAYEEDMNDEDIKIRQCAVVVYLIDKLALRIGNEKGPNEADTVGCCSLRVKHVILNNRRRTISFDFLGKDSIRYKNQMVINNALVMDNLNSFIRKKQKNDFIFDSLRCHEINRFLAQFMDGLSSRVLRTYNASLLFENQLDELTKKNDSLEEKLYAFQKANRAVAILCNHRRAVPPNFKASQKTLANKIKAKKKQIKNLKQSKTLNKGKTLKRFEDQLKKLEIQKLVKEEGKEIAPNTSKQNYIDPRITVTWCKKHGVPINKVFSKAQREKFQWAIDEVRGYRYKFCNTTT